MQEGPEGFSSPSHVNVSESAGRPRCFFMSTALHQPIPFPHAINDALARLSASPEFASSDQLRRLLAFLVQWTLEGRQDELKETVIGVEVFWRTPGYDPKADGVVRTEARRLRLKLAHYYEGTGGQDEIVIGLRPVPATPQPIARS